MIKNLPIPTDTLYKFLALFGLLVSIFSFTYPPLKIQEFNNMVYEENKKLGRALIEVKYSEQQLKYLSHLTPPSHIWDNLKFKRTRDTLLFKYYGQADTAVVSFLPINDLLLKDSFWLSRANMYNKEAKYYLMNYMEIQVISGYIDLLKKNLKVLKFTSYVIGPISFLLFLFGIRSWYVKEQKILDKKIKSES